MMLVIGAGVAGATCALTAVEQGLPVTLVTPGSFAGGEANALAGGNTALAQGGIAAALGADDSAEAHATDTVLAGAGLVDQAAATLLTAAGAAAVRALVHSGFAADRTATGELALGLEAAHRTQRIVHAGEDRTGAALHAFLTQRILSMVSQGRLQLVEETKLTSLLGRSGQITGAVLTSNSGLQWECAADTVVLATGGYAGSFVRTSNHSGARGEGIVIAARAGALVADLEFVQYHPTVLGDTATLVSEAVRGAGAVLRDRTGARYMQRVHPNAELAARDIVSRETIRVLREQDEQFVWLDATGIEHGTASGQGKGALARRFPVITKNTRALGFDWRTEPVPVAPAAHYSMGGIVTDLDGRTTVPGLFAVGEVAATGVHGANRLASNSLLEGLVFGARAALAAAELSAHRFMPWSYYGAAVSQLLAKAKPYDPAASPPVRATDQLGSALRNDLAAGNGTVTSLVAAVDAAVAAVASVDSVVNDINAVTLAELIRVAAESRTESRGSHWRDDYPETDSAQAHRQAWSMLTAGLPASLASFQSAAAFHDSGVLSHAIALPHGASEPHTAISDSAPISARRTTRSLTAC